METTSDTPDNVSPIEKAGETKSTATAEQDSEASPVPDGEFADNNVTKNSETTAKDSKTTEQEKNGSSSEDSLFFAASEASIKVEKTPRKKLLKKGKKTAGNNITGKKVGFSGELVIHT